jgi:prophage maintenance system killer protein
MLIVLSKKDIVAINAELDSGRIVNESSLDFALKTIGRSRNWLRACALLVRAVLIDHTFEDGNKRTAAAIVLTYCEMQGLHADPDKVNQAIVRILRKNITKMRAIEREIKDVIE